MRISTNLRSIGDLGFKNIAKRALVIAESEPSPSPPAPIERMGDLVVARLKNVLDASPCAKSTRPSPWMNDYEVDDPLTPFSNT